MAQIVDELAFSEATVSYDVKVRKDAVLIRGTIEGSRVCYCADREQLASLQQLVGDLVTATAAPNDECCGDE